MVVAIAIGGAVGTVGRYELALAAPVVTGHFPWATFTVNLFGSFLLGIAVVAFAEPRPVTSLARGFAVVGFCGGLTTFSTWMVESVLLTRDGDAAVAVLYLVVSLVLGFAAVALGVDVTRRILRRRVPAFDPERDE